MKVIKKGYEPTVQNHSNLLPFPCFCGKQQKTQSENAEEENLKMGANQPTSGGKHT
jgi:hypothetical protein